MCMHIFFCQEAQVFPQLNKHFVPESLMPALFLCHQMGPGFLMVKLKGFLKGESLCPLEQFLLHYQRRGTVFLSPLAAAGVSNRLRRAFFWEPYAFSGRHLARELANPAPVSKQSNKKLLGLGRRREHTLCDPTALWCSSRQG